ncbi:hypothetical protein EsH8_II_001054 [Colletotrichum jinshuiense]
MSDHIAWDSDFNKFLAELDNENNATDMGFMDLLGPIGHDFNYVDVASLGAPVAPGLRASYLKENVTPMNFDLISKAIAESDRTTSSLA